MVSGISISLYCFYHLFYLTTVVKSKMQGTVLFPFYHKQNN